jgi:homoserine kinase
LDKAIEKHEMMGMPFLTLPAVTQSVTVRVPATTANIGPGFDCLGAALSLYNTFVFTANREGAALTIAVSGVNAEQVGTGPDNLVYRAFCKVFEKLGRAVPSVTIDIQMAVPLARGLGSSATAIVGGLLGANALAGNPLSEGVVTKMAIDMEGHPDNVVPAYLGGCRLAATNLNGDWEIYSIEWNASIVPVVAIPEFELSTAEARRVLPTEYSRDDLTFNAAHLALLIKGLENGQPDGLRSALQDRVHQPYRKSLIQGYDLVQQAARDAGAYGMVISGAGPTLLALVSGVQAGAVKGAMEAAWRSAGVKAEAMILQMDVVGAVVIVG